MSSLTFFFLFIPILASILLLINIFFFLITLSPGLQVQVAIKIEWLSCFELQELSAFEDDLKQGENGMTFNIFV